MRASEWQALADLYGQLRTAGAWPEDLVRVNAWYQPHLERLHEASVAAGGGSKRCSSPAGSGAASIASSSRVAVAAE